VRALRARVWLLAAAAALVLLAVAAWWLGNTGFSAYIAYRFGGAWTRRQGVRRLVGHKKYRPVVLEALKGDSDRWVRRGLVLLLSEVAPEEAGSLAEVLLDDPDWQIRALCAQRLGRMGSHSMVAIPALIEALGDENLGVATHASYALEDLTGNQFCFRSDPLAVRFSLGQRRWRDWWAENGQSLVWDEEAQRFVPHSPGSN